MSKRATKRGHRRKITMRLSKLSKGWPLVLDVTQPTYPLQISAGPDPQHGTPVGIPAQASDRTLLPSEHQTTQSLSSTLTSPETTHYSGAQQALLHEAGKDVYPMSINKATPRGPKSPDTLGISDSQPWKDSRMCCNSLWENGTQRRGFPCSS